jgi:hypothetical protein
MLLKSKGECGKDDEKKKYAVQNHYGQIYCSYGYLRFSKILHLSWIPLCSSLLCRYADDLVGDGYVGVECRNVV